MAVSYDEFYHLSAKCTQLEGEILRTSSPGQKERLKIELKQLNFRRKAVYDAIVYRITHTRKAQEALLTLEVDCWDEEST